MPQPAGASPAADAAKASAGGFAPVRALSDVLGAETEANDGGGQRWRWHYGICRHRRAC